jgi:hypothetical protein
VLSSVLIRLLPHTYLRHDATVAVGRYPYGSPLCHVASGVLLLRPAWSMGYSNPNTFRLSLCFCAVELTLHRKPGPFGHFIPRSTHRSACSVCSAFASSEVPLKTPNSESNALAEFISL